MSKIEKIICVKELPECFSVGTIYDLSDGCIINNKKEQHFILDHGEKDDFFNEYFRPVNLVRESEPIESQQQSEHYQKDNTEDLETIEKMQIISDIFEEQGRTFTAMEGYTLLNQYKYLDRMGKKDDPKKEGYKICDYYERNKSEKWLHETSKKGDSTC